MIGHDGDAAGYQAAMDSLPEHDATVVGFANLYGYSVRGVPANAVVTAAVAHGFPKPQ